MPKKKELFSPFLKQCFVNGAVCCDVISHGCILGYMAVLLPQLQSDPEAAAIKLTEEDASWIASVMSIAMLIGIFATAPLMGRLGRKMAHYVVILTLLTAWLLYAVATNVTTLIVARLLQGLSFGIFIPLRSILIGEYTSPKNRGAFLTIIGLAQGFGILLVHLIGSILSWQTTALICGVFPSVSLVMTLYSPESPSWLADKGRYEECSKVFRWLRGDGEDDELQKMIQARIAASKEQEQAKGNQFKRLLKMMTLKEFYKPILILSHIYCAMTLSGAITIPNYAPVIITNVMGTDKNVDFWMVLFDTQRLVSNLGAIYVMDKFGRRYMMFTFLSLNILNYIAMIVYVYCREHDLLQYNALWIPILLLNIQYFSIGMGMLPLPSIIAGEIFPLQYRSIGGSISMISYSGLLFIVLKTFVLLVDSIGICGTYIIYVCILTYDLVVIGIMMPETRGKTLQEIEEGFRGTALKEKECDKDLEATEPLQNQGKDVNV